MKKISLIILLLGTTMLSCNHTPTISEKDIDKIVESILDSNQVYDIVQSLTFSNDSEQYSAVEYSQHDSTVLLVETFSSQDIEYSRQLYFKNGKVIFTKEIGYQFINETDEEYIKKTYILENETQKTYKKLLDAEGKGVFKELAETVTIDSEKPKNAVDQKRDFELKFGEFLIIEPQSYLILENKNSKYNVALFIIDGDYLLDELYTDPEKYKGKTIFVNHEKAIMGGIERMIYRGGFIIEN